MRFRFVLFLIIPLVLIIVLSIVSNYIFLYPAIKDHIIEEKKIMLKELTRVAINSIQNTYNLNKDSLADFELKELAIEQVRNLNYGNDQKSYFWITDLTPTMIMHPYRKDLEGKNLTHFMDINGKTLFKDAVDLVNKKDEGFLEYFWQWQDDSAKIVSKITFVKLYQELGWIIGTGIYINDVEIELSKLRKNELRIVLFISALILLLLIRILFYGIKAEKHRKIAQQTLELSEQKFRTIFQDSNDIILMSSLEGLILDINTKALLTYGLNYEDIVGKTTFELIPEEYHYEISKRLRELGTKELDPIGIEITPKKDVKISVEIKSSISSIGDKKVVISTLRDVSLRKIHENELISLNKSLEESESKFKKLSNLTFEGIAIHDFGVTVDINLSLLKMFGYSKEELIGKYALNMLFDEKSQATIMHSLKTNNLKPYEIIGIKKDGTKFPVEIQGKNFYVDELGKTLRVTALRDISKRKKAEMEIRKLSKAVEQSANIVIITDTKGIIEYVNEKFYKTTGYNRAEIIGHTPRILSSGKHDKKFYHNLWETIKSGKVWRGEIYNKKKNGDLFWESTLITPVFDDNKEIINFMAVKEDITEQKLSEVKLFNTIIETEEKERKKFAEDLHDELGPHLSGIRLYINELEDETLNPKRRHDIVDMLDQLVKEAIDKTRTISNQLMPSVLTDYGLIKALNSFCSRISNTNTININLVCNECDFSFDKTSEIVIYRVIIELINNTIKHAKANNINIEFLKTDAGVDLIYKDDGKGFDLEKEINNKNGLGLTNIVNRIKSVEGSYQFKSYRQKGIIFSFSFSSKNKI